MSAVMEDRGVEERLIGKTVKQKEAERAIRADERDFWASIFVKKGDGRANRKTPADVRQAYREAAAMLRQNETA